MSRLRKLNRNSFPQKPCFHFQYADRQFVRVLSVPRQRAYRWKHTKYCIHCAHIGCNRWRCILLHFAASKSSVRRKCTWSRIGRSIRQQQHRRRFPSSHKIVLHTEHAVIVHHIPLHRWIINVFFLQWRYRCGIWVVKFHRLFLTCIVHYFNFNFCFFNRLRTVILQRCIQSEYWIHIENRPISQAIGRFVWHLYWSWWDIWRRTLRFAGFEDHQIRPRSDCHCWICCAFDQLFAHLFEFTRWCTMLVFNYFSSKKKSNKLKPWMHV